MKKPKPDYRSELAKARDSWFESPQAATCLAGTAAGQYLRNRLERAFIAGYEAAECVAKLKGK